MTQAVAKILEQSGQLSTAERADLADCIVESLTNDIPPEIAAAQIFEVRRRIAQVESGEVVTIPADEVLAQVRKMTNEAQPAH